MPRREGWFVVSLVGRPGQGLCSTRLMRSTLTRLIGGMKSKRVLLLLSLVAAVPARAVYAPVPDRTPENIWTVSLRAGVMYDSNIFGAQQNEIDSVVYQASPSIGYTGSLSDQTFASFNYTLIVDHFVDRPGDKTLDSHSLFARLAHAFGPATNIDISDAYQISRNPESLLAGLPLNSNQSFRRNQLDGRFNTLPLPKLGLTLKVRSINYDYDNASLGDQLDRTENLFGVSGSHAWLPELKAVAEYRHEEISYRSGGRVKDKTSDFLIGGFDYAVAKKVSVVARLGEEWRSRSSERSTSGVYTELSGKFDYARGSVITAGYVHTLEESSNVALYTDTRVNRFFVNAQHAVTALIVASASVTYEPSELQGRRGVPDADETTTRVGAALTWLPSPRWSYSVSYDHDKIDSDDPVRGQERDRFGVSAGFTF
ncbi:MAG: hypothetical protein ABIV50_04800 [Opitutus sp.]